MTSVIEALKQRVKNQPKRIIFAEQDDPRVQQAGLELAKQQLCHPLFLSANEQNIEAFWQNDHAQTLFNQACEYYAKRAHLTHSQAQENLHNQPLLLATSLVAIGYADGGVAGSIATTGEVLKACFKGLGLAAESKLVSSVFLMQLKNRALTFGDCAVNPNPTSEQLAQIAIDSANTHQALTGETPKVALLSFSSKGSAHHPDVEKVRHAFEIAKQRQPDLLIDGELQFDSAFIPEVASIKAKDSRVAGQANVFIFPTLDAGNIAYKITERMAGATAVGPILQGLSKPWLDLSRGCHTNDIIDAAVITSVQSINA